MYTEYLSSSNHPCLNIYTWYCQGDHEPQSKLMNISQISLKSFLASISWAQIWMHFQSPQASHIGTSKPLSSWILYHNPPISKEGVSILRDFILFFCFLFGLYESKSHWNKSIFLKHWKYCLNHDIKPHSFLEYT